MDISTSEYIGMAIVAASVLAMTAQTAFELGRRVGLTRERALANHRVNSLLREERNRPHSRKNRLKAQRKATLKRTAQEVEA